MTVHPLRLHRILHYHLMSDWTRDQHLSTESPANNKVQYSLIPQIYKVESQQLTTRKLLQSTYKTAEATYFHAESRQK